MDEPAPTTLPRDNRPALRVLLTWASLVIIIAGMKAAATLVVPFLLALFLAILCGPALQWLRNHRVPQWLAMLIVLGGLCVAVLILANVGVQTITQFAETWPQTYRPKAKALTDALQQWLQSRGLAEADLPWNQWLEPNNFMTWFMGFMLAFSGLLSQTLLILVTTIFLLVEATTFPDKLRLIAGDSPNRIQEMRRIVADVNSYMAIKTSTSLLTGGIVFVCLWLLDVEFARLWGLLAFLLNYVPNIGSILAAVPAVLLTLLQLGFGTAFAVVGLYLGVNMLIGYFIEPRWMGKGLGLSTLLVFVSLVFWGWVLGPVGMVISVPLTMTVKIALENSDETKWLAILMGSSVRPSSESTTMT